MSCSCCHMIPQLSADTCLSCQLEHLGMKACFLLSSEQPLPRQVPFPALREALSSSGRACQWPRASSTSSGWCSVAPLEIRAGSPTAQTRKQAQVVRPRQACDLTVPLAPLSLTFKMVRPREFHAASFYSTAVPFATKITPPSF